MRKNEVLLVLVVLFFGTVVPVLRVLIPRRRRRKKRKHQGKNISAMTPEKFQEYRKSGAKNFEGVYVLYNKNKRMYYVGQAKQILSRVNNHFTGKGNGDVYADYKYGDRFSIRLVPLRGSGFSTLNSLERHLIGKYHAYEKGYNKTRGNQG